MTESIWNVLEQGIEAQIPPAEDVDVWNTLADRLNPARFQPRQLASCELQHHLGRIGEEYYTLTNPGGVYLKLTPAQVFVWQMLDGQHNVRDLILAYMLKYGELSPASVTQTLAALLHNGFLEQPAVDAFQQLNRRFRKSAWGVRLLIKLFGYFMNTPIAVKGIDTAYRWLYRHAGRFLFTRPVQILFAAVTVLGLIAFGYLAATRNYSVLTTNESASLGVLTLYVSMTLVAVLHESGHALTCIHYGRRVRKGGPMIYIGMLAFYIDTTDIWMAPRRARIAVSWAGPYTNLLCSSLVCLGLLFLPDGSLSEVFFKVAVMSAFLAVMNLNPLILLDGYFILMDVLEIPNLRSRAFSLLKKVLRHPSRHSLTLNRQEKILLAYGFFAAAFTFLMIFLGLRVLITAAYNGLAGLVGAAWSEAIFLTLGGLLVLLVVTNVVRNRLRARAKAKRRPPTPPLITPSSQTSPQPTKDR